MRLVSKQNRGFTVVESVVSIAVFTVALGGIMGAFMSVMRINEKARAVRAVEQNVRFINEFLAREIRNGVIDYGATGYNGTIPNGGTVQTLYLKSISGETLRIFYSNGVLQLQKSAGTSALNGSDTTFTNFNFYIRPTSPGEQGIITFAYTLQSNITNRLGGNYSLTVQSTVVARDYN